jgi:hypothetical protein
LNISRKPPYDMDYIQGEWAARAEAEFSGQPTLIVMKQKGDRSTDPTNPRDLGWDGVPFYVPTLLLPVRDYVFMFNTGVDAE